METCVQIRRPGQDEDSTKKTKFSATLPPATIKNTQSSPTTICQSHLSLDIMAPKRITDKQLVKKHRRKIAKDAGSPLTEVALEATWHLLTKQEKIDEPIRIRRLLAGGTAIGDIPLPGAPATGAPAATTGPAAAPAAIAAGATPAAAGAAPAAVGLTPAAVGATPAAVGRHQRRWGRHQRRWGQHQRRQSNKGTTTTRARVTVISVKTI